MLSFHIYILIFTKINAKKIIFGIIYKGVLYSGENMNIFKIFEIFLREPLSILRERIIQIVNINSEHNQRASVNVDMLDKKTQITVVNSDKMYNLFKTVMAKQAANAAQNLIPAPKRGQIVLGQLCKRT
jgi:hypothetical protein